VPPTASVWYYFREADYEHIMDMWHIGDHMATGATLMTDTSYTERLLGSAWPGHFSPIIAETMQANIAKVGMPQWTEADQTLAKGLQKELKVPVRGLSTTVPAGRGGAGRGRGTAAAGATDGDDAQGGRGPMPTGGGSDDIGDVSWTVPTITLRYPANIPGGPGHNWADGVAMATPIAHKGVIAGAKAQAMTMLDILTNPEIVTKAWDYFKNVQTKDVQYKSFIRDGDKPATFLNEKIMEKYRPLMKPLYYDPSKYDTYLEQLGIKYPTVR
jgi:aminobenzoyl-glutamate utilization protein B